MSSLRHTATRRIATSLTQSRAPLTTCLRALSTTTTPSLSPSALRTRTFPVAVGLQSTRSTRWNSSAAVAAGAADPPSELETPDYLSEGELKIFDIIKKELRPLRLEVQDISGGCGSMYALDIVSEQFRGLPVIKQHRLVNTVLGEEIKKWHGVQLKTKAP